MRSRYYEPYVVDKKNTTIKSNIIKYDGQYHQRNKNKNKDQQGKGIVDRTQARDTPKKGTQNAPNKTPEWTQGRRMERDM
jgi:hypothetical protein